jgi:glycosyltransferase involved in cell wall biosynthesis
MSLLPCQSFSIDDNVVGKKFIYIASGEPHKNHKVLIEAFCLLAAENIYPSLVITVDRDVFPDLCLAIEEAVNRHKLLINNVGQITSDEVMKYYRSSDGLIYPSKFESFGLPLIEAEQIGLPIIAAELDYVRDLVDPQESFDPDSAVSMSLAIKRFIGVDSGRLAVLSAEEFVDAMFIND